MPEMIRQNKNSNSRAHLLYSKNEHTYHEHIQDLIQELDAMGISHDDKVEDFAEHGEVGKYFSPWIKN